VTVQLDGKILGFCSPKQAKLIADTLRYWKVEGNKGVPVELEIGYVPLSTGGQYPGVYMFSQAARMYRPVKYIPLEKQDFVGPFEQPFMSIACTEPEITSGDSTHVEFDVTNILSIIANQTPFSNFNQSPRNMYVLSSCKVMSMLTVLSGTNVRWVSKRWVHQVLRSSTGPTTNHTDCRLVKRQSCEHRNTTSMVWTISRTEPTLLWLSFPTPATTWTTL
jgi:DNA-directed RNA polymerase I subunit RPA2